MSGFALFRNSCGSKRGNASVAIREKLMLEDQKNLLEPRTTTLAEAKKLSIGGLGPLGKLRVAHIFANNRPKMTSHIGDKCMKPCEDSSSV